MLWPYRVAAKWTRQYIIKSVRETRERDKQKTRWKCVTNAASEIVLEEFQIVVTKAKRKISQRCDMHRNGSTSSKRECATYKITITKGFFVFFIFFFTKNLLRFTERILLVESYLDSPWCALLLLFLEWIRLFSSFSIITQYNGARSQKTSTSYYYYVLLLEHKHVKTLSSNLQLLGINELALFKSSREWKSRKRDSPSWDLWTEWLRTLSVLVYVWLC